ncbi:MAG: beta-galactosidase trimerization domain-containing protein [Bryobacteraceae bacterium]
MRTIAFAVLLSAAASAQELPELRHERPIARHPKWVTGTLRVAYGHWERNKPVPLDEWAARTKAMGATALLALGNIPDVAVNHITPFPGGKWSPGYEWAAEYLAAARRHDMKLVLYGDFWDRQDEILTQHPEWREMDESGKPVKNNACFSSPFVEAFRDRLVSVLRTAPVDGLMIDMMHMGARAGCRNPYCIRAFEKRFGVNAPRTRDPKDSVFQRWMQFQAFTRENAAREWTEAAHAVNPEFAMIVNHDRGWHNNYAHNGFVSSRLEQCVDGILEEIGWDFDSSGVKPQATPVRESFQNTWLRCRRGDGASFMWMRTHAMPLVDLRARNLNMLAHGNVPAPTTGSNLEWRGVLWKDIQEREEWILGSQALPWLGMVYSENTLAWHYGATEEAASLPYVQNAYGVFQAVLEGHLPVDILSDWQLTPEALRRYRVVALPNTAALSAQALSALREYVRGGGGLVATFESSISDEAGRRRADFGLADVFGAKYGGSGKSYTISAGVWGVDHPIARDEIFRYMGIWSQGAIEPARNFQIITHKPGNSQAYEVGFARPQSRPAGALGGIRTGGPDLPAFVAREYGKGRVVWFPVDLGRAYFLNNSPATARLLQRAIRWAAKEPPPAELEGSEQVETVYYTKNGRMVVHLLNDQASYGRGAPPNPEGYGFRREILPVHELKVRLRSEAKRVLLIPGGRELPITRNGSAAEVTVPKLELHAMLVVE